MLKHITILFILLITMSPIVVAQNYLVETLTVEHGLSYTAVQHIIQDDDGFLWIATLNGLNRYDGYDFKVYKHDPVDEFSLSSNKIGELAIIDGELWVPTTNGLNVLNLETERFRLILKDGDPVHPPNQNLDRCKEDVFGNVWISSSGGISRYDRKNEQLRTFLPDKTDPGSIGSRLTNNLIVGQDKTIWISTFNGLSRLDSANYEAGIFKTYRNDLNDPLSLPFNVVKSMAQDGYGKIWFSSPLGFARFDPVTERCLPVKLSGDPALSTDQKLLSYMLLEPDRLLLMMKSQEIYELQIPADIESACQVRKVPFPSTLFAESWRMYQDYSGNLWLATVRDGLRKVNLQQSPFGSILLNDLKPRDEQIQQFSSFAEDKAGNLFAGDYQGEIVTLTNNNVENLPEVIDISNYPVNALVQDGKGELWKATESVVALWHPRQKRFSDRVIISHYPSPDAPAGVLQHRGILYDVAGSHAGGLWIGAYNSLLRYAKDSSSLKELKASDIGLISGAYKAIVETRSGELWAGTALNGLGRIVFDKLQPENLRVDSVFTYETKFSDGMQNSDVNCLFEDHLGDMWVGTRDGLLHWERSSERWTSFEQKDGLTHNNICAIIEDESFNLWISTHRGITLLNRSEKDWSFSAFTEEDGLQGNVYLVGSGFKSRTGKLYFGGTNGISVINPGEVQRNTYVPKLAITDIVVGREAVRGSRQYSLQKPLEVNYSKKSIRFEFSALDFTAPQKNRYRYILEGFDSEWTVTQPAIRGRTASYTNLDPGSYVFRVTGSNSDGLWSEAGTALKLIIPPPYWQTWWFRALALLAIVLIPLLIYRNRILSMLAMEKLRVQIASDLHDDVGASLTSIAMKAELLKGGIKPEKAEKHLSDIVHSSRTAVGQMSDLVWSVDARNDQFKNLLDRMKDFAEELLRERGVQVHYSTSGIDAEKELPVDLRQNLYFIFKEALNNVAKYANATTVQVQLSNDSKRFRMCIADDGIGAENALKRSGHGLKNMRMRATAIGGNITIANDNGLIIILERAAI